MDYNEFMVAPEELEFQRADAEQQRALRMINERDKAALIVLAVMGVLMGIIAAVVLFKFVGIIGGIVALALVAVMFALAFWYALTVLPKKGYHDFEIVQAQVVKTYYRTNELREADLWVEEQQKCVRYVNRRSGNHIHEGAQGYFVRGITEGRKDYFFVTDHEYKIMKMNADNRR